MRQPPSPAKPRQGQLFDLSCGTHTPLSSAQQLPLEARQLLQWRHDLGSFQAPLFNTPDRSHCQGELFSQGADDQLASADRLNPLELQAQGLSFWRWPQAPQRGAALYFLVDAAVAASEHPALLLYVGETGKADQRWKGDHDCKHYLASYSEALSRAGLTSQLSIRFWLDVPHNVRQRRALEQRLIRRWWPPFNKETRQRWATPFTSECC
jgi:hypothetical protein